jgi:hypothetical protein
MSRKQIPNFSFLHIPIQTQDIYRTLHNTPSSTHKPPTKIQRRSRQILWIVGGKICARQTVDFLIGIALGKPTQAAPKAVFESGTNPIWATVTRLSPEEPQLTSAI